MIKKTKTANPAAIKTIKRALEMTSPTDLFVGSTPAPKVILVSLVGWAKTVPRVKRYPAEDNKAASFFISKLILVPSKTRCQVPGEPLTEYYFIYIVILMIQYITTLTQKGQATIPVSLRRKLGLKKGHRILFEERGGEVLVKKISSLEELQGSLKSRIRFNDKEADKVIEKAVAKDYARKWQK